MKNKILGCGIFDEKNPNLFRSCGDILFSNKIWLCDECRKKRYTKEERKILDNEGR